MTDKSKSFADVFDAHTFAEFQARDIEATMATMGGARRTSSTSRP
jgi:hypothetical protein